MGNTAPPALDLKNIQGDILLGGLPKKTQIFSFFQINTDRVQDFRKQLAQLIPLITTSDKVKQDRAQISNSPAGTLLKISGVNISFSQKGLKVLGINDAIGDGPFAQGMLAGAKDLGDPGTTSGNKFTPNWNPAFKQDIHGVFLVTAESRDTAQATFAQIIKNFSVGAPRMELFFEVTRVIGDVRPGDQKGHEHFGFLDGISEPAVQGVDTKTNRGQETIRQGIVLLGRDGDSVSRPSWALDGSFLSFRYLSQLVPEFNAFLAKNAIKGLPTKQGADLLGARLVGRWKSGAPVDVTPTVDDPALGADPTRNNDFSYNLLFPDDQSTQDRCPFAAHVRKTNPRSDLSQFGGTEIRRIVRSGIPFGPEVAADETTTRQDRGLLFVAYQSNIGNGFQFIQQSWANAPGFPPKSVESGFDPIIGQVNDPSQSSNFSIFGTDPNNQSGKINLTQWVIPKGGEYFFSPSIPALKKTFALGAS